MTIRKDSPSLMDTEEAARFLNISPRTLERDRRFGRGPSFCRFGKTVRYPRAALEKYISQNMQEND